MATPGNKLFAPLNLILVGITAGGIYGAEVAHKAGLAYLKRLPALGVISAPVEESPSLNLEQVALLSTRYNQAAAGAAGAADHSIDDAFSPREAVTLAAPPKAEEFVAPPLPTAGPATPPEDMRKVFAAAFPLDGVASNGAFFNMRFVPKGGVIFDGTAPGKEATVLAKLKSVDSSGAWVEVNGETIRMDVKYPGET